jgi:predicted metal-dependent peptidase
MYMHFLEALIKGFFLAILYFEITKTNDTTFRNVGFFTTFYVTMYYGGSVVGIDPILITNAFITKTVFTIIDERIRKEQYIDKVIK